LLASLPGSPDGLPINSNSTVSKAPRRFTV
jgi:hypothetical protein